jgi:plastocyanin
MLKWCKKCLQRNNMKSNKTVWSAGVLLFASGLVLSACSSSPAPEATSDAETRVWPVIHHVEISLMKFQPEELKVHKGDSVVWTNNDITIHDVTEEPGHIWTSKPIAAGASWGMKVEKSADYFCSIHKVMKGKLIVE